MFIQWRMIMKVIHTMAIRLLLVAVLLNAAMTWASNYTYTYFEFPEAYFTCGQAINNSEQIVGWYHDGQIDNPYRGFMKDGEVYTSIDYPDSTSHTVCYGINNAGDIVGSYWSDIKYDRHGFLKKGPLFTTIDFPGATFTDPHGINDYGQIVGVYASGFAPNIILHGFLKDGDTLCEY
jgi:hypothetical protein